MRVVDVLVAAPAAASEVWALRHGAFRRWLEDFDELRFRELLFLANDPGGNALANDCERNEHSLSFEAADAGAAKCNVLNFKFDLTHGDYCRDASKRCHP